MIERESSPYNRRWRKARLSFLAKNPLCKECTADGRVVAATVVDHIKPHKGDLVLFWNPANWAPLCETHHNQKTAREDGGFGRAPSAPKRRIGVDGWPIERKII